VGQDPPLQGLAAAAGDLPEAIPFALEAGFDLLLLEGAGPVAGAWPELSGAPDLSVLRDAIRILRELNREEDIELLYFGGVRSGTDAAKLIGLGANAVVVGMSLALAVGGQIDSGSIAFYGDIEQADRNEKAELFLNALRTEASIMPRCTGKTVIHNLEPEDLRSISVVTAQACGIPLAGFNPRLATAGA
jgi:glutamate synthase domain-containing protein 2